VQGAIDPSGSYERKRKIETAIAEGKNQKTFAQDELGIGLTALHKFMNKNGMPKWHKTKRLKVEAALFNAMANGSDNVKMEDLGKTVGATRNTMSLALKGMQAVDPNLVWTKGGVTEKNLIFRKALAAAKKDGSVRIPFIRTFANPFPCVAIPASCASTRLSVAAPSQVVRARLCSSRRILPERLDSR
jgi:hypothetical protein